MMYGLNSDFQKRNVVIYARVSTEHDAQLSALENQVEWYRPILAARPEWTLVDSYIDEGITGTSAEKRPQFMKMIRDAKTRKFNMIITREVSRFARNTVDTLQYTRALKEYGVEVFFINDNIKTFDGDGELRLTIMATLAQDESRKTSIRVKSGQQTSMDKGVLYGNGNILGYDRKGKEMIINPEQAKTVRMIYDLYLSGMGCNKIQYELEKAGRLTAMGKEKWFCSTILHVLKNSFYCGIITYHKEYTPDYLKQKKIKNFGEMEFTRTQGTHETIVTVEEFERVQRMLAERTVQMNYLETGRRNQGKQTPKTVWGKMLQCQCGASMNMRTWNRYKGKSDSAFICYTTANKGSMQTRINKGLSLEGCCDTPTIPRWKLEMMARCIFKEYLEKPDGIVALAVKMLEDHLSDTKDIQDHSDTIARKQSEYDQLSKKLDNLIELRTDGDISKEQFRKKSEELEKRMDQLREDIHRLKPVVEEERQDDFSERLDILKKKLHEYVSFKKSDAIPEEVVEAFVEKIIASKDEFKWYLRVDPKAMKKGRKKLIELPDADEDREHILIASFTIDLKMAKKYVYEFSTRRRVHRWTDLKVSIWL